VARRACRCASAVQERGSPSGQARCPSPALSRCPAAREDLRVYHGELSMGASKETSRPPVPHGVPTGARTR
jgi:hypothetical protein